MIIAIDGPAGSGKSTVARQVASSLGFTYVDSGAMYRAVTLAALEEGVSLEDADVLGTLALGLDLRLEATADGTPLVHLGDREVTEEIRTQTISHKVSLVAAHDTVREALLARQRDLARSGDVVMDGRDIGTVVCPDAELKIYLDASLQERARRRRIQLEEQGVSASQKSLERDLLLRDSFDSERAVAPLQKARDAHEIDTTHLTVGEVVERIVGLAEPLRSGSGYRDADPDPEGSGQSPC